MYILVSNSVHSITIPLIGTKALGGDAAVYARTLVQALLAYLEANQSSTTLRSINLISNVDGHVREWIRSVSREMGLALELSTSNRQWFWQEDLSKCRDGNTWRPYARDENNQIDQAYEYWRRSGMPDTCVNFSVDISGRSEEESKGSDK